MSPDCRGSLFVFQMLARIVGVVLGTTPMSKWIRNAALLIGMFMDPKERLFDEWTQKCMEPWSSSDALGRAYHALGHGF